MQKSSIESLDLFSQFHEWIIRSSLLTLVDLISGFLNPTAFLNKSMQELVAVKSHIYGEGESDQKMFKNLSMDKCKNIEI